MLERPLVKRDYVLDITYKHFYNDFKKNFPDIKCVIAGSIRREKEFVHDIDILVVSKEQEIIDWCQQKIGIENKLGLFYNCITGKLSNINTQIWFCSENNYGPSLVKWTGPHTFSVRLASIAKKKGGMFSEDGLFKGTPENRGERLDTNSESSIIWLILNRKWIHPKDRF